MKILVAGCGSIGKRHARNAIRVAEAAVFDTDPQVLSNCEREYGIQAFADLKTALEWKPDGVVIATPTNLHIPVALASIEAGADVLIEKPISHSSDGVEAFLERAENLKRKIFVACNMRFHPAIHTICKNLDTVGKPFFARAHYGNYLPEMRPNVNYRKLYSASRSQGGGVILDGIHELDYLVWLFGGIQEVLCRAARLSDLEIDTEDYAGILLRHQTGVVSEIHLDYLRPFKLRGCEVVGDRGMLIWRSEGKNPEKCSVRIYRRQTQKWESLLNSENLDINQPYETMMEHFIEGIQGNNVPILTGREAAEELTVALKALESSSSIKS